MIVLALLAGCSDDPFESEFGDAERGEIGDTTGGAGGDAVTESEQVQELDGRIDEFEGRVE